MPKASRSTGLRKLTKEDIISMAMPRCGGLGRPELEAAFNAIVEAVRRGVYGGHDIELRDFLVVRQIFKAERLAKLRGEVRKIPARRYAKVKFSKRWGDDLIETPVQDAFLFERPTLRGSSPGPRAVL